ncbi:MAG: hypothetical protein ACK4MQ_04565 [Hyphomonas sp.]
MTRAKETVGRNDFRYGRVQRYTAAFLIGLMWLLVLMLVGLGAEFIPAGEIVLGLCLLGAGVFLAAVSRVMARDYVFRSRWRVTLGPEEA